MSETKRLRLMNKTAREMAVTLARAPELAGWGVTFSPPTRSLQQNALMWKRLEQLSREVKWDGETLTSSEWKDLLSACLRKQKVVRGIEGGLVFLGARTSQMSVSEMSDLLALMDAFAAERGVQWSADETVVEMMRR